MLMFLWLKWTTALLLGRFLGPEYSLLLLPRVTCLSYKNNYPIANVSSEVPAANHLYVDGSLHDDGYAIYSPNMELPEGDWVGH